jgi:gliding motility-associated-like protein
MSKQISTFLLFFLFSAGLAHAQLTATSSDVKNSCDGLNNGSFVITVDPPGTTGPYSIFVFGLSFSQIVSTSVNDVSVPVNINGLRPDTYLVNVGDSDPETPNYTLFVTINSVGPNLNAAVVSSSNNTICANPNGSINIDVTGGSGTYSYAWTGPAGFTDPGTQDLSNLAGGSYSVLISDDGTNCTRTLGPIEISDPSPLLQTVITPSPQVLCEGQDASISLADSQGPPVQYQVFINGVAFGSPQQNPGGGPLTLSVPAASVADGDVLSVIATHGLCTPLQMNGTVTVSLSPTPVAPNVTFSPSTVCVGDAITPPAITTPVAGSTYTWFSDAGLTTVLTTGTNPSNAQLGFSSAAANTTTVYVRETSSGGCPGPATTVTLTVNAQPLAPTVNFTPDTYCAGETINPPTIDAPNGGSTYTWYSDAGLTTTLTTGTTPTAAQLGFSSATANSTTVYVRETNGTNCSGPATTVTLTVNASPLAPGVTFTPDTYCVGETIIPPTITTPVGGSTYTWYSDVSLTNVLATGTTPTNVQLGFSSAAANITTVYVRETNSANCPGPATTVTLTVNAVPPAPAVAFSPDTYCVGETITAPSIAAPVGGSTYIWYSDAGLTNILTSGTSPSAAQLGFSSAAPNSTTVYVTETSASNCVSPATPVTLTVNAVPSAPVVSFTPDTYCQGEAITPPVISTPVGGSTYTWYSDAGLTNVLTTGTSPSNNQLGFSSATANVTTVFVVETNASNCAGPATTVTLTVNANPVAPGVTFSPNTYCVGETITPPSITTPVGGSTYTWYSDAGLTTILTTGTTPTNIQLGFSSAAANSTSVYVRETNTSGCFGPATTVTLTVNEVPSAPVVTFTPDTYCVGETITPPAISSPVGGSTYTWFSDAGLTNVLTTGTNPTNVQLGFSSASANTTTVYVREISSGSCASPATAVTLTVNAAPDAPAVTFTPNTYCAGESIVSPFITTPAGGTTYTWYSDVALTNILTTGTAPTNVQLGFSSAAANITTVYVVATNASNCTSSATTVTLTVNDNPVAPAVTFDPSEYCQGETITPPVITTPTGGSTYTWYSDAGLTTVLTTGATPTNVQLGFSSATPNTTTVYVSETAAGNCQGPATAVTLTVNPAATTANAGTDQTLCNTSTTLAANTAVVGTGLWTIESGAGGALADATDPASGFTGVGGTTYVLRWTITNGSCTPSFDEVQIVFDAAPTVATAGGDQTVCGTNATLAANTPVVGTGLWTVESGTGGTLANPSDPASGFAGTTGTSYTLRWTISNGTCTPTFDEVQIHFEAEPSNASAGADQSVCNTTTTLAANAPAVGTGMWSILSGTGGSVLTPSDPGSSFTGIGGQTYVLRWTVSNGTCPINTDDVQITLQVAPSTATAGGDQTVCDVATVLAANTPAEGSGLWTIISGAGGAIADDINPASAFSGVAGNSYVLRWTITNACGSSEDDVTVTFDAAPTTASAGADKTICGSEALEGNAPVTGTGLWSVISGTGGVIVNPSDPATAFSGVAGNVYVLRWTISNGSCSASFDEVEITIDNNSPTVADAGADQAICGSETTLAGNTPLVGTGEWSVISGAGGVVATVSDPLSSFTGEAGAAYTLRWTITSGVGGCSSSFDEVNIIFENAPTLSDAGADQAVCTTTAVLAANAPSSGTGTWTVINGSGGDFANAADPATTFTGVQGTTYVLQWTIENSCGNSTDDVQITLLQEPSVANAGPDQTVCGEATLQGNTPVHGTGTWTIVSGTGGVIADSSSPVSTFSGTGGTSYTLRWTISNGACTSSVDEVMITFDDDTPTTANAGNDLEICGLDADLDANTPTVGTGNWSIISGTGGVFTDDTNPDSEFTGNAGETYILRWTITSGCGVSSDDVQVVFNEPATVAEAGADQSVCGPTTLEGNTVLVGTGTWTVEAGTGGVLADAQNPVSGFAGVAGTSYTLRWTISSGACPATFDEVIITFDENTPTVADAGADQALCSTSATLSGNTPTIGTGSWSILSGVGGTLDDIADPASGFSGAAGTTYVLRWTISSGVGGCAESTDDVTVSFDLDPSVADAGADQQVCAASAVLAATVPVSGSGEWSVISGTGGAFADAGDPATTFTGVAGTTYTLQWTITTACGTSSDEVVITLEAAPTVANAGADKTVCGPTTLEANTPAAGTGIWTILSGSGGVLADAANPTSTFSGVAGTTYTLQWTISNGSCTASTDEVDITFDNDTPTIADAGPDQAICGNNATLAANTPVSGTGEWSIVSGDNGAIIDPANPASVFDGVAGTTYTLRWTISSGATNCSASMDDVVIAFETAPSTAVAGADQTICATSATLAATVPASGTGTWSVVSGTGGIIQNVNDPASGFTGTAGVTYTLAWTVENSCGTTSDEVTIQLQEAPSVANAGVDQVLCNSINTVLAANTPTVGTGIWTIMSGTGGAVTSPSSPTSQFVGTLGVSYTLRWNILNGACAASTDDVVINLAASPATTNPVTVCVNNAKPTLTATAAGAIGFNWYYYTDPSDVTTRTLLANTVQGSYTPGNELDVTAPGSVTYEVTAVYGCGESPASQFVVNVSNTGGCAVVGGNCAEVVITPVPSPATCTLSNGSIYFEIIPFTPSVNNVGVVIEINGISATNSNVSRTNYNDPQFNGLPMGRYEYTVIYGDPSCTKPGFVTIDQSGTVGTPVATNVINPVCAGSATGAVTINVEGETGNLLEWSVDGLNWTSFLSGTQITGIPAGPAPTFERLISVRRNASDPCNAAVIIVIQDENDPILFGQLTTTNVSVCGGEDGSITVPSITGGSGVKQIRLYAISQDGPQIVQNYTNVAGSSFVFTDMGSGTYFIEIRDELGCTVTSAADPVTVSAPGAVKFSVDVIANAECDNGGKNGVVRIRFDATEKSGTYQIGIGTSPLIEPSRYFSYAYFQGIVEDILVDTLSRGNYFVFIKPTGTNVCPSVKTTGFIDGPYPVSFDVQRVCGINDGSASVDLVNVQGDPAIFTYNIEVYKVSDPASVLDEFTADAINNVISIDYVPNGGGVHSWLATPGEYIIKIFQINQLYCLGERPPRTPFAQQPFIVAQDMNLVVEKVKASYPEPRQSGGFTLKTIIGGLPFRDDNGSYYNVSLIDPATGAELFGPLKVRRNSQNNFQYEFRNMPVGNYRIEVTDAYGCVATYVVIVPADTRILIPNIFTPNGDAINDLFEIVNLPSGGGHKMVISNRWGKEVFSSSNYQEGTFWDAEGTPEGIYFYRLQVQGDKTYTGWVEVARGSKP